MSHVRRLAEDEVPVALSLLTASGGTVRTRDSWDFDQMTALALEDAGTVVAVMPLSKRTIRTAPGRDLGAGWLSSNQFASRMSWRRQTRESSPQWPALLPETDALFVVRRDERALLNSGAGAARWLRQTGFADVLSIRCLYLDMESPPAPSGGGGAISAAGPGNQGGAGRYHTQVVDPGEAAWNATLWQTQMAAVYADVYGACGGAMKRSDHFWGPALAHHFYRAHYQFQIIGLWSAPPAAAPDQASLVGYAVVGWSGWHSKRPRMDILELATRQWDSGVAGELIRTTCQLAWSKNVRQVRAVISVHDPYRGHLARIGFVDRWGYQMLARWLHPQRYLDALAARLPRELGDFWLQLSTPGEMPLFLGRGPRSAPSHSISLQADSGTITRLLLNRLEISAAVQDGTLLASREMSDADLARLSSCFPWAPWAFHMLDYI